MHVTRVLACFIVIALAAGAHAKTLRYTKDEDGNPTLWQESKTELPPFPEEQNLLRFPAPVGGEQNEYFIDENSIALGADRVVRYTVVIRSRGGARNVVHEGLACEFREVKVYAYGNGQRSFTPLSNPTWSRLSARGARGYQGLLANRYLCDESHSYLDREHILDRLKYAGIADDNIGVDGSDND